MFTGIIQALGSVVSIAQGRFLVSVPDPGADDPWKLGESISVNGCCLTLVSTVPDLLFDLSSETLRRTAFSTLELGSIVNVERAMRPSDRFGGHIVSGHIDAVGKLIARTEVGDTVQFRFQLPDEGVHYLIDKGSIAIDGISLTVVDPTGPCFDVWVIPHTLQETTLGTLKPGSSVNLEYDLVAKYIEKLAGRTGNFRFKHVDN